MRSLVGCRPRVLEMDKEENRRPAAAGQRRHSASADEHRKRDVDEDKHCESSSRKVKMRRH